MAFLIYTFIIYRNRNNRTIFKLSFLPYLTNVHVSILFLSCNMYFMNMIQTPQAITGIVNLSQDFSRIVSILGVIINMTFYFLGSILRFECFNSESAWGSSSKLEPHILLTLTRLISSLLIPLQMYGAGNGAQYSMNVILCFTSFFMVSHVLYSVPYISKIGN